MANKTLILNDETKRNSHGFYLLNSGGRFDRFNENPVMLDSHNLTELLGRWHNLRISGSTLLADAEFDVADEKAARRAGQVERGFMRGASVGIVILSAEYRINHEGDTDPELYVTDWELFEASICTVPSNAGALTLSIYNSGGAKVSDIKTHLNEVVKLSAATNNIIDMTQPTPLSVAALNALSLSANADSGAICGAITALKSDHDALTAELTTLKAKLAADADEKAEQLINSAQCSGKFTADNKASFLAFAKSDFEACSAMLAAIPTKQSIGDKITTINLGVDRENWSYFDWKNRDEKGLTALQINQPEKYKLLTQKLK